jgi:dolichol-phosphate mannosyltransferase
VVFVDDGSHDKTSEKIRELVATEALGWKLVCLSRNFGHQAAITAGMSHANGEGLIFLDADMQDPPEMIPLFLEKFLAGYDVVYGVRQNRKEPLKTLTNFLGVLLLAQKSLFRLFLNLPLQTFNLI